MEVWKPVKDFSKYQVSNLGRVRKLRKNGWYVVKQSVSGKYDHDSPKDSWWNRGIMKYKKLSDHKKRTVYIHRLVAETFIPNPQKKEYVTHKNFIKHDNRAENLMWVDRSENNKRLKEYKNLKFEEFLKQKRELNDKI